MLSSFLEVLFGDYTDKNLWIEVRRIAPPSQRFFAISDITGVTYDAEGDTNVFVGVLPRTRKGGTAADVVKTTNILWADLDKKSGVTFETIIDSLLPMPNIILDSGHGWHLYWLLEDSVSTDEAQRLMGDIAYVLGGDAVGDPARIMRLPSTVNQKPGEAPIKVRIISYRKGLRHRASDFDMGGKRVSRQSIRAKGKMNGQKTRSEELFGIAVDGVLHGQSRDQIVKRMHDDPAGSKLAEMPSGRRTAWIDNALKSAKKIISKQR